MLSCLGAMISGEWFRDLIKDIYGKLTVDCFKNATAEQLTRRRIFDIAYRITVRSKSCAAKNTHPTFAAMIANGCSERAKRRRLYSLQSLRSPSRRHRPPP